MRRNLKGCLEKLRETAYFTLVRSFLEYSAIVWHPHQKYNSDKLEMVQRRAARFVKGRYGPYGMYESVTQMLGFHYQKDVKTLVSFFSTRLSTISSKYVHAVRLSLTFFDMKSDFFQIPKYLKPDMEIK